MGFVGAVDLGATRYRVAVADSEGTIQGRRERQTPQGPTADAVTGAVLDGLRAVSADVGVQATDLEAVGIGSIGPLDRDGGAVAAGVNLDGDVDRIPLRDPMADLTEGPVVLHNDAIAGVIGERQAYRDPPTDLVYLTISTGIGVGAIVDGHVLSGRGGNAGELGHLVVDPDGRLECGCGAAGHWEAYCSGRNLPSLARLLAEDETALDLDGLTAADIFAEPGNPLSARTIETMTRYNAVGLAAAIHAFAPARVAIGGAVALENPSRVIEPLRDRVPPLLAVPVPEIRAATHGHDAVLRGAIVAAQAATGP